MRTRVGYTGGSLKDPTYQNLGNHTEAIQIDFDPGVTSYRELLAAFWQWHRPVAAAWSQQYKSAVYVHDARQRADVAAELLVTQERVGVKIHTEIHDLDVFYRAEDYHQKYRLRRDRAWMDVLRAIYTDELTFVDSTVAMWANAFLDGAISKSEFRARLGKVALSEQARAQVLAVLAS